MVSSKAATVAQFPARMGELGAQAALDAINGETVEPLIDTAAVWKPGVSCEASITTRKVAGVTPFMLSNEIHGTFADTCHARPEGFEESSIGTVRLE